MEILLDGREIRTESDFHNLIDETARRAGFPCYGRNLDALWDILTGILPPPLKVHWVHSDLSRAALGPRFDELLDVFRDAEVELGSAEFQLRVQP